MPFYILFATLRVSRVIVRFFFFIIFSFFFSKFETHGLARVPSIKRTPSPPFVTNVVRARFLGARKFEKYEIIPPVIYRELQDVIMEKSHYAEGHSLSGKIEEIYR